MDKGYGNLAASIGSSMKSTSFILTVSNSQRGSKLFEYLKVAPIAPPNPTTKISNINTSNAFES